MSLYEHIVPGNNEEVILDNCNVVYQLEFTIYQQLVGQFLR